MARPSRVKDRDSVVAAIRRRAAQGLSLWPGKVKQSHGALFLAGRRHFDSWRKAVEAAGVVYPVPPRPQVNWTRAEVIRRIKARHKAGERLNRRAIELCAATLVCHARRLFGTWEAAITAAGLDYALVRSKRRWTDAEIIEGLRARHRAGLPVNSGAVRRDDSVLASLCYYHFGTWRRALKVAGIPYVKPARPPSKWNRDKLVDEVRRLASDIATGRNPDECKRRRQYLVGVGSRHVGWAKAVKAAGLTPLSLQDSHIDRIAQLWARDREPWTPAETARLEYLVGNNTSVLAIAIHLARTETTIAAKAQELHLRLAPQQT